MVIRFITIINIHVIFIVGTSAVTILVFLTLIRFLEKYQYTIPWKKISIFHTIYETTGKTTIYTDIQIFIFYNLGNCVAMAYTEHRAIKKLLTKIKIKKVNSQS